MKHFSYKDTTYEVDEQGFLLDSKFWDENFAEGMARECDIPELTKEHWDVIRHMREVHAAWGACPTIFAVCKANGLRPREMKQLFPTGYHRGLSRIAGVHYHVHRQLDDGHVQEMTADLEALSGDKHYTVDVRGFLVDSDSWDKHYALHRALEMKIPHGQLTDKHWRVIDFLRDTYTKEGRVANIYETCEHCQLDFDEFETLFPEGYHRGAVKMAGLRFVK